MSEKTVERPEPRSLKGDHQAVRLAYQRWYRNQRSVNPWTAATNEMVTFFASPEGQAALAAFRGDARREEPTDDDVAAIKAENDRYRDIYGCLSCDESHPRGVMCPPHEVRSFEPWWRKKLSALAAQRDAAQSEVDRLTKERDEARQQSVGGWTEAHVALAATDCECPEPGLEGVLKGIEQLAERVGELEEERDKAIAEANRRDEKWKAGIQEACGCRIAFDVWQSDDTLEQFIGKLKARAESAEREAARLRSEASRQSAPRPLPAGHDWKMVRRRFNEALTNEWHWIQATGKAGLALLDWAESAQPDAPSIESRLSNLEAAVAKMEGER